MLPYDFATGTPRRGTDSAKWSLFGDDVLPLWVADMDFAAPPPVVAALRARVDHSVFGYSMDCPPLREALCARMARQFGWAVQPEWVVFLPGVLTGFNMAAAAACTSAGHAILMQPPVYPPFLGTPAWRGVAMVQASLRAADGYAFDAAAFEAAIVPGTRLFLFCSPHNPLGTVWPRADLEAMAEVCLRHDLIVCSDEIWHDLVIEPGVAHTPFAALSPEVAARTITLVAPSKTFNVPGLNCAAAIIADEALRQRFELAGAGLAAHVGPLGYAGALAAYTEGDDWLAALRTFLRTQRDFVVDYVAAQMPGVRANRPDATYLTWLDCRDAHLPDNAPAAFFQAHAGVALMEGGIFGPGGEGFARLNFATPRATLEEALGRMAAALAAR